MTFGLWTPFWLLATLIASMRRSSIDSKRMQNNEPKKSSDKKPGWTETIVVGFLLAVLGLIVVMAMIAGQR